MLLLIKVNDTFTTQEVDMKTYLGLAVFIAAGCSPALDQPYVTLENSQIVCEECTSEELALEDRGIRRAAHALIEYVGGSDLMPDFSPLVIHVSEDAICPKLPGTAAYCNVGYICLFNYEHHKNSCAEYAPIDELPSQELLAHEGLHEWFMGRLKVSYIVEEGFCDYVGLEVSRFLEWRVKFDSNLSTDPCTALHGPDAQLMRELCSLGITSEQVQAALKGTDEAAVRNGRPLTAAEFSSVVTQAMGQDSLPAFRKVGAL